MKRTKHFIGVDIASESFTASIWTTSTQALRTYDKLCNSINGFHEFSRWLKEQQVTAKNSTICMEATGVYGEQLCYFLATHGFPVAVEAPHKVKRAFPTLGHKTDHTDSQHIAEYAYRYHDELRLWQPHQQIVEQISVLLTTREQFVKQKTANTSSLKTIIRKYYQTPLANDLFKKNIAKLNESIQSIDTEIKKLIDKDSSFKQMIALLKTIPGVGLLLASNFLVLTQGFSEPMNYKKLSAYIGICPYKHSSGKSVYKRPRSAGFGPAY